MNRAFWAVFWALNVLQVHANVEKIVFVAPQGQTLPKDASIDNLLLNSLSPANSTVRTYLNATFPTKPKPHGTTTWMLLEDLEPGMRYEVRICWIATVSYLCFGVLVFRRCSPDIR